jgi:hypothetical protein
VAACVVSLLCILLASGPLFHAVIPELKALWISREIAGAARKWGIASGRDAWVVASRYQEPSLVFLLGTDLRFVNPEDAVQHLATRSAALAVVGEENDSLFRSRAAMLDRSPRLLETIRGFHYTKGRWQVLRLYQLQGKRASAFQRDGLPAGSASQ